MTDRPEIVEEEHLTFLDELQESATTNMYGASSYLQGEFGVSRFQAKDILKYWMESYDERHPEVA